MRGHMTIARRGERWALTRTDDVCEAGGVEEFIAAKWVAEETIWVGSQELRRRGRIREYIQSPHVSVGWKGCRLR